MIEEKILSKVIKMERQGQEEKQEIQQQLVMNSIGSLDTHGSR
jgi:hypothetical protein